MNNGVFGKTMENVRKQRYQNLSQQKEKKKLFGARTKLPYYKVFNRKSIHNRNEEKTQILIISMSI